MMRGNLIVFEGVDGAGTTTQAEKLREAFASRGLPAHVTAQPSGGPIGTMIRQILSGRLITTGGKSPGWATMSLLFAADRQDLQECEIEPSLREGVNIICDRYVQSSAIYQSMSAGKEESVDWILEINKQIRTPDTVFYLKISPEEAAARRDKRAGAEEIFDKFEFQKQLATEYDKLSEYFPDVKIITINAERPTEEIADEIWRIVEDIRSMGAPR